MIYLAFTIIFVGLLVELTVITNSIIKTVCKKKENKMSDTFSVKKIKKLKIHEVEGIKLCIDGLYIINVSRMFGGKDIPENAVCRKITTNNTCYELEVEE